MPVTTFNRYQILAEATEGTEQIKLIGDSIIRNQLVEFCGRDPSHRKRHCIPGASVDDVTAAYEELTQEANDKTLIIIHAGTNDVKRTASEALLAKYREMINKYKAKTRNIIISGILPRVNAENSFYSKAFSINNCLENVCKGEGVEFINLWNHFYNQPILFRDDGLHLNSVGSARLGRLLNDAVSLHKSKNAKRGEAAVTT